MSNIELRWVERKVLGLKDERGRIPICGVERVLQYRERIIESQMNAGGFPTFWPTDKFTDWRDVPVEVE